MRPKIKFVGFLAIALVAYATAAFAQNPVDGPRTQADERPSNSVRLHDYVLGPDDEITIFSVQAEEIANKQFRIGTSGDLNIPLVGRVHAAGLTVEGLQDEINNRLKNYIKEPDAAISVTQSRSQPVSVFGSVAKPGIVQLEGRKTLIEVLTLAGGLSNDAGSRIKITRMHQYGPIPLPTAKTDGDYSIAEVNANSLRDATEPQDNIQIMPNDVIAVSRADIVYVIGEVRKPGGFVLNDRKNVSLIEALARADGPGVTAAVKDARIIRPVPGSERIEIAVNLDAVLKGKAKDVMLQADDILYVPNSYVKGAWRKTLDTTISLTTGMLIYR
jgi:polysaccharide biosynthesis/export protein